MHTPQQHKFGFKAWIPTIGLAFAAFVFNTSEFLPVGLLPNIAESIHESVSKTGLMITVYAWVVSLHSQYPEQKAQAGEENDKDL